MFGGQDFSGKLSEGGKVFIGGVGSGEVKRFQGRFVEGGKKGRGGGRAGGQAWGLGVDSN